MLKPQEALLETTAQKIARILIRQYGINVRVEGSRACIDMETMTVVIPNLSGKEAEDLGEQGDGDQGQAGGDDQDQDGDQEGEGGQDGEAVMWAASS